MGNNKSLDLSSNPNDCLDPYWPKSNLSHNPSDALAIKYDAFANKSYESPRKPSQTRFIDDYAISTTLLKNNNEFKRGQSFHFRNHGKNSKPTQAIPIVFAGQSNGVDQINPLEDHNFKRINSLPPSTLRFMKKNKKQQMVGQLAQINGQPHLQTLVESRTFHKGFDMIRHHFGQKDCEWTPRLAELETSILLLNEKVSDLEHYRQDCLRKLSAVKWELEQQEEQRKRITSFQQRGENDSNKHNNHAHTIRIQFLENYMKRLENLLRIDHEPFLAVPSSMKNQTLPPMTAPSSQTDESENENSSNIRPSPSMIKCQQIKQCYDYLLKTVMPQLYGNKNVLRQSSSMVASSDNYLQFRRTLCELRHRVQMIPIQQEQQLIDAKRAFLVEVDSYLRTLDEMANNSQQTIQP